MSPGSVIAAIVLLAAAGALVLVAQRRARHPLPTRVAAGGLALCGISLLVPEPAGSVVAIVGILALIPIAVVRIADRG